jgi:hypothetical protein
MVTSLPPRGDLSIRSSDSGHVIALYNPILIVCFTRAPRGEEIELMRAVVAEAVAAGIRGGLLYVVARKDMAGGVDPRVRAALEEMMKRNPQQTGGNAVVVLTGGFGGAVVRSVIAGFALLTPHRKRIQVFGAAEEACRWLAKDYDLDAKRLLAVYRKATAHLTMPGDVA